MAFCYQTDKQTDRHTHTHRQANWSKNITPPRFRGGEITFPILWITTKFEHTGTQKTFSWGPRCLVVRIMTCVEVASSWVRFHERIIFLNNQKQVFFLFNWFYLFKLMYNMVIYGIKMMVMKYFIKCNMLYVHTCPYCNFLQFCSQRVWLTDYLNDWILIHFRPEAHNEICTHSQHWQVV